MPITGGNQGISYSIDMEAIKQDQEMRLRQIKNTMMVPTTTNKEEEKE